MGRLASQKHLVAAVVVAADAAAAAVADRTLLVASGAEFFG